MTPSRRGPPAEPTPREPEPPDEPDRVYEAEAERRFEQLHREVAIWALRGALALGWLEVSDED